MTADPIQHAAAVMIAAKIEAFYSSISPQIRAEIALDWGDSRHWRTTRGECVHCHSPQPTNLADDQGRNSHKMCAEISAYLKGPPEETSGPERVSLPIRFGPSRPPESAWWLEVYTPKMIDLLAEQGPMKPAKIAEYFDATSGLVDVVCAAHPNLFDYQRGRAVVRLR
jgi:hypothetical protein